MSLLENNPLIKRKEGFCKKCEKITIKRLIKDKQYPYYMYSICLENSCKSHRKRNWEKYLAQKANSRKKLNSTKLTGEHIKKLYVQQNGCCILSGVNFDIDSKWNRPSLDRIDNSKGYTEDNIQLVTWIINYTRGELSINEYIDVCKKVVERKGGVCGL